MTAPGIGVVYRIGLCSGEQRRWRYLGTDSRAAAWWTDLDTGLTFNESSLMYVWQILGEDSPGNETTVKHLTVR